MKKLKLKAFEIGATEVLTREQMKNVLRSTVGGGCGMWLVCTKCCTPDGSLCGQCNSIAGTCGGNGVLVICGGAS